MSKILHRNRKSKLGIIINNHIINHKKEYLIVIILFLIGLENANYQENLDFTNKISDLLNQKVKGLSKGIYKKEGPLVNGVYNQDFSNRVILIEVGGNENTIDEVYRSLIVLGEVLDEVIKND